MPFDNIVLDPNYNNGVQIELLDGAKVGTVDSGGDYTISRWSGLRALYTLPYRYGDPALTRALIAFNKLRAGTVRSFLFWDFFNCYQTNQNLGNGTGAKTAFQLIATITDAANTLSFNVLHPVPTGTAIPKQYQGAGPGGTTAAMIVTVNGVAKTEGVDFTVNTSTGVITFTVAPPNGHPVVAGFWMYICVRFYRPIRLTWSGLQADIDAQLIQDLVN